MIFSAKEKFSMKKTPEEIKLVKGLEVACPQKLQNPILQAHLATDEHGR